MKNQIKNQMTRAGVILAIMMCATSSLNAQWNTNGNSLSPTEFIGTITGNIQDMRFQLNGAQRMVLNSASGYLGIGATAPLSNLHVSGSNAASLTTNGISTLQAGNYQMRFDATRIQSTATGANGTSYSPLYLNPFKGRVGIGVSTYPSSRLYLEADAGERAFQVSINGSTKLMVESNGGTALGYGSTSTPPTNGLLISGNTGIGTTSPACKLHVYGGNTPASLSSNGALTVGSYTTGTVPLYKQMRFDGSVIQTTTTNLIPVSGTSLSLNPYGGNVGIGTTSLSARLGVVSGVGERPLQVVIDGSTKLMVESNGGIAMGYGSSNVPPSNGLIVSGNVGIGTASPNNKLDVCGTIRAKEVKVETGWCDYVFADDYKLPSLSEVETFIKEHKHLPEVTAGNIIETEGLEVGKVASQMIKKIEELTLYVIELQKQVDTLKTTK